MVLFALQAHYEMKISSGLVVAKAKVALRLKPNNKIMNKKQLELLKQAIQETCYDYLIDELSEEYETLEEDLFNNIKEKLN